MWWSKDIIEYNNWASQFRPIKTDRLGIVNNINEAWFDRPIEGSICLRHRCNKSESPTDIIFFCQVNR